MPAEQKGSVYATKTGYGVRWLEQGQRRHQSGFASRTAARNHFRDEIAPRLAGSPTVDRSITLKAFVELYLAHHATEIEASTLTVLKSSLNAATKKFGDVPLAKLERQSIEIAAWRASLKSGSRVGATKALRQCLAYAVEHKVIRENPAAAVKNKAPKRAEIVPYTDDELDRICTELGDLHAPIVRFAAATSMRPCEWLALRWSDVDRAKRVVYVERTFSRGVLRPFGKTDRSRRSVPLSRDALDALSSITRRLDTPLIFPTVTGQQMHLENWREREWRPALDASGVGHGNVYTLRHTGITSMIAAGITVHDVARFVGTSVVQISKTYGHLSDDAVGRALELLDARSG